MIKTHRADLKNICQYISRLFNKILHSKELQEQNDEDNNFA